MSAAQGVIGHFDISGGDIAGLSSFYREVLGWAVEDRGPGYAQVETPSLRGALVEAPESSLTLGVVVEDLDAALLDAAAAGGSVVMPATDNGWVRKAQVADPAGNVLTLIQK
ncbi:VOC family protein [Agreia sp. PsM10]|uniref:VOC family protein n=1 Tax=Agreia sp. PsM10 TaxID=3030533 RepID=UPI00263AA67C|nr:VOC family protein [Agreia sp. PsM10]MDN4638863.1 VOC family protein [Agreia sp. PsM10]